MTRAGTLHSPPKLQHLHDGVEVACVSQVAHAGSTGDNLWLCHGQSMGGGNQAWCHNKKRWNLRFNAPFNTSNEG